MEDYRDLEIHGERGALEALMNDLTTQLDTGWSHDVASEQGLGSGMHCFAFEGSDQLPAAKVWLAYRDDADLLRVSNITPQATGSLTIGEYNAILEEFHRQLTDANEGGLNIVLTSDAKTLEDSLSPETARKLQTFSSAANKSEGASHHYDQQRWFDFLLAVYKEQPDFDGSTLGRWLREMGWSEAVASDLIIQYEFAQVLLAFADRHQ